MVFGCIALPRLEKREKENGIVCCGLVKGETESRMANVIGGSNESRVACRGYHE